MSRRAFISGIIIVLAVLAACEIGARRLLPKLPPCDETHRNPYRFRGWPEYMRVKSAPGEARLLFLLSNSQAYGGEFSSVQIYPNLLELKLNEPGGAGGKPWRVCNWSVNGTTSMEYGLMAARLKSMRPDVVMTVIGYADFRGENFDKGFSYCRSDIPRLSTRPGVARDLPDGFMRRHGRAEQWLTDFLNDRLALFRLREYLWSWLDFRFPGIQTVWYAPMVNYRFWEVGGKPLVPALDFTWYEEQGVDFSYDGQSKFLLKEYLAALARLPCRAIVVNAPVKITETDKRTTWHEIYCRDLAGLCGELGLEYWDLTGGLPAEDFLTSSHFNRKNHKRFAELLAERLAADTGS